MRKITEAAANAFKAKRDFSRDNTTVLVSDNYVAMYLHGNRIAYQHLDGGNLRVTLAGWGTPTTRERVNGLLEVMGVQAWYYQKNKRQRFAYGVSDREVSPKDWFTVRID